jgi:hypothetical protein
MMDYADIKEGLCIKQVVNSVEECKEAGKKLG